MTLACDYEECQTVLHHFLCKINELFHLADGSLAAIDPCCTLLHSWRYAPL